MRQTRFALFGAIGTGKTQVANALCTRLGYQRLSFAEPIRRMLLSIGIPDHDVRVDKEKPQDILCGRTCREALQTLGTEWGRKMMGGDIWSNALGKIIQDLPPVSRLVIDDLRYPNEYEVLKANGFSFIRLTRDGVRNYSTHDSERFIDSIDHDIVLHLPDESDYAPDMRGVWAANTLHDWATASWT